jgi:hypothetical protein
LDILCSFANTQYTLKDPVEGKVLGKVDFDNNSGYVITRTTLIFHPELHRPVMLHVEAVGSCRNSEDVLSLNDQVYSGIHMYNRWGEELQPFPGLLDSVNALFPLPYCRRVTVDADQTLIQL